ncbi:MAG: hypothetical protein Q4G43_02535 [Mobilicoccus sp.]|nr:hypothetical protein [Mobilicoccus sp.]
MTMELFLTIAPGVLVLVALVFLVRRGVRRGEIRRLSPEERDVLRERGIGSTGTGRKLTPDERRRLRDGTLVPRADE